MSEEELMRRIEELESENSMLRARVKIQKPSRAVCPDWIGEKYGGHKLTSGHFIHDLQFLGAGDLADVSKLIRRVCFQKEKATHKRRGGAYRVSIEGAIKMDAMTDEQYDTYSKILDEVIGILHRHAYKEAE